MQTRGPGVAIVERDSEGVATNPDVPDTALAARGDTRAFERLYRQHVARVHGLARRMMGDDQAAELTQEVFVRAWEKLWTFRGEAAFGTWLHRVAINVILARRSARSLEQSRVREGLDILDTIPARRGNPDLRMDFDAALVRLPDGARQIFVLHDMEGYKHDEIATLLGITSGTSKAQLHRARMLLRRHLDR